MHACVHVFACVCILRGSIQWHLQVAGTVGRRACKDSHVQLTQAELALADSWNP